MLHAKNGIVKLTGGEMEYIRFGNGPRKLVMIPGLGDGLRTMRGTALPMALMYAAFSGTHTVYAFSRRSHLPEGYCTRDMARDQIEAMDVLGISVADVLGVSMGGMIAQHMAIDYPERIGKLVLVVTSSRPNPILEESIAEWLSQAERGDHRALMDSNLRRIYSEKYYRQNKWMIPFVGRLTKPKSYQRFFVQARACLSHNAYEALPRIQAPTLILGGEQDLSLGGEASREIARQIPGARLKMYPQWGHGLYEEAKDFQQVVLAFLKE